MREELGGRPVPIRVQRRNETVFEAINALYFAGKTKYARLMILVIHGSLPDPELSAKIPPEISLVTTPAVSICEQIEKVKQDLQAEALMQQENVPGNLEHERINPLQMRMDI